MTSFLTIPQDQNATDSSKHCQAGLAHCVFGMKRYGWAGHILRVDLCSGKTRKEESDSYVDEFIEGRGLGQSLLFRELAPDAGALDPRNPLILAAGPLAGTPAPGSGRLSLSGKNLPQGDRIFQCGGTFWAGAEVCRVQSEKE